MMIPKLAISGMITALYLTASQANADADIRQFYISKSDQMLRLYENGELMEEFRISTGKSGHETPSGIFSVIHKRKYHESNIYSNAPMPFMQRITWSGIALHEGRVPNYPASHGCIRIPKVWAQHLYNLSSPGTVVITSQEPLRPDRISHSFLPGKQRISASQQIAGADTEFDDASTADRPPAALLDTMTTQSIQDNQSKTTTQAKKPLKLLITWRDSRDKIRWSQTQLTDLGFDAGIADGVIGAQTKAALDAFRRWKKLAPNTNLLDEVVQKALQDSSFASPLSNGVMRLRQNFKALTEFDVTIADPTRELGTHFLQALIPASDDRASHWSRVSLPNKLSAVTRNRLGLATTTTDTTAVAFQDIEDIFQRLTLPQDAQDFLEENFTTRMSLTITDYSHQTETGEGTEFTTITKDS